MEKIVLTLTSIGTIKTADGFTLQNCDVDSHFTIKMIIPVGQHNDSCHIKYDFKRNDSAESAFL